MLELLIIGGKKNDDPPDSVKWWIGDWMNYGQKILPNYKDCFDSAIWGACYFTHDTCVKEI